MNYLKGLALAGIVAVPLVFGFSQCKTSKREDKPRVVAVRETEYSWTKSGREWLNGYLQTQKFLKENPGRSFSPSKKDFQKMGEKNSLEGKLFSDFTKENAINLAQTQWFCHEKSSNLMKYIMENKMSATGSDVYVAVDSILKDKNYLKLMSDLYGSEGMDCKKISSTVVAREVSRFIIEGREGNVTLCTGIYFGEKAMNGMGHQWARVGNEIVDPALRPLGKFRGYNAGEMYVPIVETTMHVKGETAKGSTKIVTMPFEYLRKDR